MGGLHEDTTSILRFRYLQLLRHGGNGHKFGRCDRQWPGFRLFLPFFKDYLLFFVIQVFIYHSSRRTMLHFHSQISCVSWKRNCIKVNFIECLGPHQPDRCFFCGCAWNKSTNKSNNGEMIFANKSQRCGENGCLWQDYYSECGTIPPPPGLTWSTPSQRGFLWVRLKIYFEGQGIQSPFFW